MEYQRVARALRAGIDEGRWRPGDKLPSEYELVQEYGVSRNTVRKALDGLANMNIIRRVQGKGSFVAEQGVSHVLGDLRSFTEILRALGKVPGIRDISVEIDPQPPAEALEFLPGSTAWLVQRTRTADDRPFCLMQSWLPDAVGARIPIEAFSETQSLYALLDSRLGLRAVEATEMIRAEAASRADAQALDVPTGFPLLSIYRWTSGPGGTPIEYVRSASPGDRYQYIAKLKQ